ncbi:hypothetical protein E2C01_092892 [Portunus trituberculatus]|uniref:Uncharacterized protein n=1 Tax=Portunus trituberculatus TaxID=210409 RepID=A0A5B7JND5_PORTR|nr:hypothetical protein [Portunus trituberculatus]
MSLQGEQEGRQAVILTSFTHHITTTTTSKARKRGDQPTNHPAKKSHEADERTDGSAKFPEIVIGKRHLPCSSTSVHFSYRGVLSRSPPYPITNPFGDNAPRDLCKLGKCFLYGVIGLASEGFSLGDAAP